MNFPLSVFPKEWLPKRFHAYGSVMVRGFLPEVCARLFCGSENPCDAVQRRGNIPLRRRIRCTQLSDAERPLGFEGKGLDGGNTMGRAETVTRFVFRSPAAASAAGKLRGYALRKADTPTSTRPWMNDYLDEKVM